MTEKPRPLIEPLQSSHYRDPLVVAIDAEEKTCDAEEKTCKGCRHLLIVLFHGVPAQSCQKGRKHRSPKCYVEAQGTTCQGGR